MSDSSERRRISSLVSAVLAAARSFFELRPELLQFQVLRLQDDEAFEVGVHARLLFREITQRVRVAFSGEGPGFRAQGPAN